MPQAPLPVGNYQAFVRHGELVAVSGISSARAGVLITGKVGRELGWKKVASPASRGKSVGRAG